MKECLKLCLPLREAGFYLSYHLALLIDVQDVGKAFHIAKLYKLEDRPVGLELLPEKRQLPADGNDLQPPQGNLG